jgi:hypothetical protein
MLGLRYRSIYEEGAEPRISTEEFRTAGVPAIVL